MNKPILLGVLAGVMVGAFVASDPAQPAVPAAPLPLKIGHSTWIGYGPLFIARDKGYFRDEGLHVELLHIKGTQEQFSALASGQIDGLASTLDELTVHWRPEVPSVAILGLDDSSGGDGLLVRKPSNIKSIKDLKGKSVALPLTSTSHFFLNFLLQQHGMSETDVTLKDMVADAAAAAIVEGTVDAAVTWQPHLSEAARDPDVTLLISSKETPGLIADVLVVRKNVLTAHPEAGTGLVRAWNKAIDYSKANADDAAMIMGKGVGYEEPEALQADLAGVTLYGKERNAQFFSGSGPGTALATVTFAIKLWTHLGRITTPIKAEDLIDAAYLEK